MFMLPNGKASQLSEVND